MNTWKALIVAIGAVLTLAACGGGSALPGTGDASGCTAKGASTTAASQFSKIVEDPNTVGRFDPNDMTVKVGQAIEWDWQDPNVQHSVTSDNGATFDSCLQSKGYKFIVTFTTAGTIPYHCTIHPSMIGTITVSQ